MDLTYNQAIEKVIQEKGGIACLTQIYQDIWKYKNKDNINGKTPDKTIQEKCLRNSNLVRVARGVYAVKDYLKNFDSNNVVRILKDNHKIYDVIQEKQETQKESIQKVRIGQNIFRKRLIENFECCPITGISASDVLIASHIKPWIFSSNSERLDIYNGLLLSPLFDKLFDNRLGWITFDSNKRMLFSSKMSRDMQMYLNRIGVFHQQTFEALPIEGREEYLEYHQDNIFLD